jgi:hypothetical protein
MQRWGFLGEREAAGIGDEREGFSAKRKVSSVAKGGKVGGVDLLNGKCDRQKAQRDRDVLENPDYKSLIRSTTKNNKVYYRTECNFFQNNFIFRPVTSVQ